MKLHHLRWGWLVLVIACTRSNEPLPNKNTNWLNACDSADDCAAGQTCLCGICTTPCATASGCGRDGVEASCVPIADPRIDAQCAANDHGDAVAICAAACEGVSDCDAIGPGLACSEAICVQSTFAVRDAGQLNTGLSGPDAALGDAAAVTAGAPDAEVADAMVDASAMPPDAGDDAGAIACGPCPEGWSCIDGMCAQILATGQPGLVSFARDSERLYWVNTGSYDRHDNYQHDGSVVAMPIGGGEIVTLAEGRLWPRGLEIDDGYAYWVETAIVRVALSGGTPEPIVSAMAISESIAVDDTYVYFFGEDAAFKPWLKRAPKDGSAEAEELIALDMLFGGADVVVDDQTLYWVGHHEILSAPKDGSAEARSVLGREPANIVVEGGAVYIAGGTGFRAELYVVRPGDELTLARVEDSEMSFEDDVDPFDVALDTEHVYWTWTYWNEAATGVLARSEKSPGETEILWSSELLVNPLIALDDEYVYLGIRGETLASEGTVLRIAKQGGEETP